MSSGQVVVGDDFFSSRHIEDDGTSAAEIQAMVTEMATVMCTTYADTLAKLKRSGM